MQKFVKRPYFAKHFAEKARKSLKSTKNRPKRVKTAISTDGKALQRLWCVDLKLTNTMILISVPERGANSVIMMVLLVMNEWLFFSFLLMVLLRP